MSFEPQKVIEFDKGKQIGQTLTQHADNIPYEDTTVGAELDSINTHLSSYRKPDYANRVIMTSLPYTAPSDGVFLLDIGDAVNGGLRLITINDIALFTAVILAGEKKLYTLPCGQGDVLTSSVIWGTWCFVPYKN